MKCNICNTEFKEYKNAIVRKSWLDAGGFGHVPESARVHQKCDEKEQKMIAQGIIKLENLYKIKKKQFAPAFPALFMARERINEMIKFKFKVNNSFLQYKTRPITIPKTQVDYEQIKKEQLASDNVRVICPGNEQMSGGIYAGVAGYGPYYQVRISGSSKDPLKNLPFGTKLNVLIEKKGSVIEVRLNKI